ncbi:MAG: hypothetical protein SFV81_11170 [Pirellulaceae bacterium]|nr:hypothetical protein [Pirellulaceae bacterium]
MEDHVLLYKLDSIDRFHAMNLSEFSRVLGDVVQPQSQIARNTGFIADWQYVGSIEN